MLYQLKYQNDLGQTIAFGGTNYAFVDTNTPHASASSYRLNKFDGFGDVGADIQRQKAPYQDGSTHVDTVLEERPLFIEFTLNANNFIELSEMRRNISRVFNPKINGKLELSYGGNTYVIDCVPEHVPIFADGGTDSVGNTQVGVIDLIAPNPYWKSTTVIEEPMAAFVELFELPSDEFWEVGEDGDLYFEMGMEGEKRIFEINGDAEVPVHITFNGPSTNPVVRNNTTGQFIKVNRALNTGDVLVIDTNDALVEINGVDAFPWIDINSSFWKLQVGENEVEYTADAGAEEAELVISWQERFNAV